MEICLEEERGSVSLLLREKICRKYARGLATRQHGWEGKQIGFIGSGDYCPKQKNGAEAPLGCLGNEYFNPP